MATSTQLRDVSRSPTKAAASRSGASIVNAVAGVVRAAGLTSIRGVSHSYGTEYWNIAEYE